MLCTIFCYILITSLDRGLDAQTATANSLGAVKSIYVDVFGSKAQSPDLKKEVAAGLRKSKVFTVADSPQSADAILTGEGNIYLKGYVSLNPRAGVSPANGQPIYGGSLSVELKDRNGDTLWSYLAASRLGTSDPGHELSKDVIKHLLIAKAKEAKP